MAIILSIETASNACSVALHESGVLIYSTALFKSRSSAEMLTVMIENALKTSKLNLSNLSAIAISKGPGSYTGLRIGVSTVKGICYAKDLPLVAVNTLDIMIDQIRPLHKGAVCPMLDARRMEVYCKIESEVKGEVLPTRAEVIDADSFKDILSNDQVLFFGEGASKCQLVIKHPNAHFLNDSIAPLASHMGKLAFAKFSGNQLENVAEFEPYYLKEFIGTEAKKNKKVTA